jgi:hypothetical protein
MDDSMVAGEMRQRIQPITNTLLFANIAGNESLKPAFTSQSGCGDVLLRFFRILLSYDWDQ